MRVTRLSEFVVAGVLLLIPDAVSAQPAPASYEIVSPKAGEPLIYAPATSQTFTVGEKLEPGTAYTSVRSFAWPGSQRVQLWFESFYLGQSSTLTVRSPNSGREQRFDQNGLKGAKGYSAVFPGDELQVILNVVAGDSEVFYELPKMIVSSIPKDGGIEDEQAAGEEQICGSDHRMVSSERQVGRTVYSGCTAFLIGNRLLLTAGHCTLPVHERVEFNVAPSSSEGETEPALPRDQYAVVFPILGRANDETATLGDPYPQHGDDWQLFAVRPNDETGRTPGEAQGGFFPVLRRIEPTKVTVIGYGQDADPPEANQAQQTASGGFNGIVSTTINDVVILHSVDTRKGNSGSPILALDATGATVAIGVHTGGICVTEGDSPNRGTSFQNEGLWQTIQGAMPPSAATP